MARPADQQGSPLSRVIFEALDGMWQLTVLCSGCLNQVLNQGYETEMANVRYKAQPYGQGAGECEFCRHEIRSEVDPLIGA